LKEQGLYLSGNACSQLYFSHWVPNGQARAVVAMVHGFGEHAGRYDAWAKRFNEQGVAFCAIDLPGHGLSSGKRGYVRSYELLLKDIDTFLLKVTELYPSLPIILYGHSMGGNIVVNYAFRRRRFFKLLIVSSPWLSLTMPIPSYKMKFIEMMAHFFPRFTIKSPLDEADLSSISEVGINYIADPLVHNRMSMSLLCQVIKYGKNAIGQVYKITVPMFLTHGTADAFTSYKSSIEFARNTSDFITFKLWNEMGHELHHEVIKDQYFDAIMEWIDVQLPLVSLS